MITVNVSVKKHHVYEKDYIWNPCTCSCKNGICLASIMDDSAITCDEVIESYNDKTKTIPTIFNEKKAICKMQDFYILLAFLLITIALLLFDKILSKTKTFITILRHK